MARTRHDVGQSERGGFRRTVCRLLDDGRLEAADTVVGGDGAARLFARHMPTRANLTE